MSDISDTRPLAPVPAHLNVRLNGRAQRLTYEQAFVMAFALIEQKQYENAAKLFERLEQFADRGPRAFIMQAFCEAAVLHFDSCSKPLAIAFDGTDSSVAADLHNAFISYHVGIRQEAIASLIQLVNRTRDLPTVCLLLGDMLRSVGQIEMARKCWSLAIKRDWPNGSVALVAARRLSGGGTQ